MLDTRCPWLQRCCSAPLSDANGYYVDIRRVDSCRVNLGYGAFSMCVNGEPTRVRIFEDILQVYNLFPVGP